MNKKKSAAAPVSVKEIIADLENVRNNPTNSPKSKEAPSDDLIVPILFFSKIQE